MHLMIYTKESQLLFFKDFMGFKSKIRSNYLIFEKSFNAWYKEY